MVPYLRIYVSAQNFALVKVRKFWRQIWKNCFKTASEKYLNNPFLIPNFISFSFGQNFVIWQTREYWFQIWQNVFKITGQKNQKYLLFPNLKFFWFAQVFTFDKLKGANSKHDKIPFFKFQSKNTQRHFCCQIYSLLFVQKTLYFVKFQCFDSNYNNIFTKLKLQNTQAWRFWSQFFRLFVLHKLLHIDKFEGVDFKYENGWFKVQSKNAQIRNFFSPNLKTFLFNKTLHFHKVKSFNFKYSNIVFKFLLENT